MNKYRNKRTDGFDSKKERDRYYELLLLQRAGRICALSRQVPFELTPKRRVGKKLIRESVYIADFTYWEDGHFVVEDCKGFRTKEYNLKKKILLDKYGYLIRET